MSSETKNRKAPGLVIRDADRRLKELCMQGLNERFGNRPPAAVKKRLQHELNVVAKNRHSSYYLLVSLLAKEAERLKETFYLRGTITSSLITYVNGASRINPMEKEYGGINLPFEITGEEYAPATPALELQCSFTFLILAQSYIIRELPEYRLIAYPLESQGGRTMRLLFAHKDHLPLNAKRLEEDEEWRFPDFLYCDEYDYIILAGSAYQELVAYNTYADDPVYFSENDAYALIPDLWKYAKDNDPSLSGFKRLKVSIYEELLTVRGMAHSTGVWRGNAKKLVLDGHLPLADMIGTRDDLFLYLRKIGYSARDAFFLMDRVRRGRHLTDEQRADMSAHGAEEWVLDLCSNAKYLFPRAHIAQMIRQDAFCLRMPAAE